MNHNRAGTVHWLIAAQQQLADAMVRELATSPDSGPFDQKQRQLNEILLNTFAHAQTIIVRERLQGFRPKPDLHVLLVEVFPALDEPGSGSELRTDPEARIVKIAERRELLQAEWDGWHRCRPPGMYGDTILTTLHCGPRDDSGRLTSLLYGEGHAVLASGDALDLEAAFVDCCLFGTPSLRSLQHGIQRLFSRLHRRYYRRSFVTKPRETLETAFHLQKRVTDGLQKWRDALPVNALTAGAKSPAGMPTKSAEPEELEERALTDAERLRLRRQALRALAGRSATFFDPCDYMQFMLENPQHAPRILCGCSHGDLHGRNILVSPMQDAVGSMCVFDYEDMRPDNAVGWDFVKLETELKIRVYPQIFKGKLPDYVRQVHDFEEVVARRMEEIHDNGKDKPLEVPGKRRGERLARLILTIRCQAQSCLGTLQQRQRDWLEEYYFLLLCYGCAMAKIPYRPRELLAGYVAAGVASRRLDLPWRTFKVRIEKAKADAQQQIGNAALALKNPCSEEEISALFQSQSLNRMSYHACLAYATVWSRAGAQQKTTVQSAATLLELLRAAYPHALEIDEELVLAYLELHHPAEADRILDQMEARYGNEVSDEFLCRSGRMEKDKAIEKWTDTELPAQAKGHLEQALKCYRRAHERSQSYYPAVNIASLQYILEGGNLDGAKVDVNEARQAIEQGQQPEGDELRWFHATWGEVLFLEGKHAEARQRYQLAVEGPSCRQQYKESMLRQLRLLLRVADKTATSFWTEPVLKDVFGKEVRQTVPQ